MLTVGGDPRNTYDRFSQVALGASRGGGTPYDCLFGGRDRGLLPAQQPQLASTPWVLVAGTRMPEVQAPLTVDND